METITEEERLQIMYVFNYGLNKMRASADRNVQTIAENVREVELGTKLSLLLQANSKPNTDHT